MNGIEYVMAVTLEQLRQRERAGERLDSHDTALRDMLAHAASQGPQVSKAEQQRRERAARQMRSRLDTIADQLRRPIAPSPIAGPAGATGSYLQWAYQRPCNICDKLGPCMHREPEVELAYAEIGGYLRIQECA